MRPACEGIDTNIWFEAEPAYDPELATLICKSCPLREDCLTFFIREPHGIFGGLTPSQRDRLRRARKAS
jgi:hypothetical protein